MEKNLIRTQMLLSKAATDRLATARIAVFGIGGVGGFAVEALARSGVGALDLYDHDTVSVSNLNRQIVALHSTIGQYKVDVMANRVADIRPETKVRPIRLFFTPENADQIDFASYDYVIDAIDNVTGKIELIVRCKTADVPILCAMGAGNRVSAAAFAVADITKTSGCPLARVMRRELRNRGIAGCKVIYNPTPACTPLPLVQEEGRRNVPGSVAWVPSALGLMLAGEVIKDLTSDLWPQMA